MCFSCSFALLGFGLSRAGGREKKILNPRCPSWTHSRAVDHLDPWCPSWTHSRSVDHLDPWCPSWTHSRLWRLTLELESAKSIN